ncbi:hypothetical protein Taro_025121 [Colocasia esculenta]|uniref:Uncharacterized protein n=1 Tax=Colocasia esculenta TaxID=4460 RepID=A0A843V2E4_COLES|nr:hypothetical protein [Colocasia esculenta]
MKQRSPQKEAFHKDAADGSFRRQKMLGEEALDETLEGGTLLHEIPCLGFPPEVLQPEVDSHFSWGRLQKSQGQLQNKLGVDSS